MNDILPSVNATLLHCVDSTVEDIYRSQDSYSQAAVASVSTDRERWILSGDYCLTCSGVLLHHYRSSLLKKTVSAPGTSLYLSSPSGYS